MKIADVKVGQEYLVMGDTFSRMERQLQNDHWRRRKAGEDVDEEWRLFFLPLKLQDSKPHRVRVVEKSLPYGKTNRRTGVKIEVDCAFARRLPESIGYGFELDENGEFVEDTHTFEYVVDARSLIDPIEYEVERFRFRLDLKEWSQMDEATRPPLLQYLKSEEGS